MNVENVNKLIEATKAFEGFSFQNSCECFLGVARKAIKLNGDNEYVGSGDLANWLQLPFEAGEELAFAYEISCQTGEWDAIDKAHALRTLEHLKATGVVDWKATQ